MKSLKTLTRPTLNNRSWYVKNQLHFGGHCFSGQTSSVKIHIDGGSGEVVFRTFIREHGSEVRARLVDLIGFYEYFELQIGNEILTGKETLLESYEASGNGPDGDVFALMIIFTQDRASPGFKWKRAE